MDNKHLLEELNALEQLLNRLDLKNPEDHEELEKIHKYLNNVLSELHEEDEDE